MKPPRTKLFFNNFYFLFIIYVKSINSTNNLQIIIQLIMNSIVHQQTVAFEASVISGKLSEEVYRKYILSDASIAQACDFDCVMVRNACQCPNNRLCKDLFSRSSGPKFIKSLRESFFDPDGSVRSRRKNFLQALGFLSTQGEDGRRSITYTINSALVCKVCYKNYIYIYTYILILMLSYVVCCSATL